MYKSHTCQKESQKKVYLMFPCCHSSPEAFHLSFVLKVGGWHGLIIQKLITQVVMLLWTMVWEEMGKPIYESRVTGCLVIGILSLTSSSSYTSLRKSYKRINHVQFRSEHTSSF